ncbi:hypothetical protein ESZ36_04830 [Colwellia demingiae]|uniref:Uncharacterized protein n=1 Tax=Colwellia demingiae TaxID=89401 RepID=A0A5C6QQ09_9GAMM|nr:hypothetical protein [Colwellia demingiae]TWX70969.1 hypothetical protein ESZ36_04830 [Colwellia demingiae]
MSNNTSFATLLSPTIVSTLLTIVVFSGISPSVSQAYASVDKTIKKITLPASTISLPKSELPGYNLALQK